MNNPLIISLTTSLLLQSQNYNRYSTLFVLISARHGPVIHPSLSVNTLPSELVEVQRLCPVVNPQSSKSEPPFSEGTIHHLGSDAKPCTVVQKWSLLHLFFTAPVLWHRQHFRFEVAPWNNKIFESFPPGLSDCCPQLNGRWMWVLSEAWTQCWRPPTNMRFHSSNHRESRCCGRSPQTHSLGSTELLIPHLAHTTIRSFKTPAAQ